MTSKYMASPFHGMTQAVAIITMWIKGPSEANVLRTRWRSLFILWMDEVDRRVNVFSRS